MSASAADPRLAGARAAPARSIRFSWSDPVFRNIVWQVLVVGLLVALVWYLVGNTSRNLEARHIATGFGFLSRNAGIPIGEALIPYDPAVNTYFHALIEGVLNTLKVAVVGIVLTTVLGTLVGVGRLSKNWLLARVCAVYVEVLRDIPVLLQLLFWYTLLQGLPGPRQAISIGDAAFLSNRGIKVPLLTWTDAHWWALATFAIGVVLLFPLNRLALRRQDITGRKPDVWPCAVVLLGMAPAIVWYMLGAPWQVDYPALKGFNFQGGGLISPEYTALTLGLVIYTSAFIAENVRSGILAVPPGQWEAARALGLHGGQILRKIVLPQAMRVIIPPTTSEYLSLTKNSSLAVAIGYQDIVSIANTILNQTGQAIEGIAIIMAVYLTISLSISFVMNWYNARIALVER